MVNSDPSNSVVTFFKDKEGSDQRYELLVERHENCAKFASITRIRGSDRISTISEELLEKKTISIDSIDEFCHADFNETERVALNDIKPALLTNDLYTMSRAVPQ
ncbi:hypothetical protein KIN20_029909 [Parelaphostrongylus tenuis]|uniref:Uncharacterized protein n=1 Tax=Parelaphostrongylus tenuis TaxID=148309 RepID=A0AAD5R341_PARTN|nr:hypothetical protein KIN20_029909 [Parelaphostrongylus tenuis]